MPANWKENLSAAQSLLGGKEFRHGVEAIAASSIGTQFFCEMKVEQGFIHGEIETEEKTEGDVLHEQLLAMQPTTQRELLEGIEKRKLYVASFPLAAEFGNLVLMGVPDAIVFQNGRPTYVLELKTTRGDATILYDGQRAQTVIYGLLLDQVGFDCQGLKLVVVKFRRQTPLDDKQRNEFLEVLTKALVSGSDLGRFASASDNQIVVHSFPYLREEASRTMTKTEGYWLGERDPVPSSNPNKCRACEFRQVCPSSLAK
jgi:predicted RecB family nuclease